MKELLKRGLFFIKENPRIIYSLILIFFIPLAIFLNTYFTIKQFEENLNKIIRSKAALAEDIIKFTARDILDDSEKLEKLIKETKELNSDIGDFKIFSFNKEKDVFEIVASGKKEEVGKETTNTAENFYQRLAWNEPENNISYLNISEGQRKWNILETLKDEKGEKKALILLSFPLVEFDKMNQQAEIRSYVILVATIIIILLLVANNARLFGYALTLAKLKEVDAMKDTFISMASHELKSPLTSMKGNVEFLREEIEPHLNEQGKRYIQNIAGSVERLEMLVGDILEVSRLEGNRLPVNISKVETKSLIEKCIEEIKPQLNQKGLKLNFEAGNLPPVKADPERVKQILINLLSNAVKYTPKGKVEILTEVKEKELLITVADTGVGISAENMAKLFQKFSRIYNEETRTVSGTGLGLWISRELARKMGGDITVESIQGVGSHFILHLPLF